MALDGSRLLALALGRWLFVELAGTQVGQQAEFSMVRLKRRRATSNGSFSFTRMVVIESNFQNVCRSLLQGRSRLVTRYQRFPVTN
jgi:hypothetical protein